MKPLFPAPGYVEDLQPEVGKENLLLIGATTAAMIKELTEPPGKNLWKTMRRSV